MARRPAHKNPWMKFYPSDWRADPRLRMCSLAARGLWMEMLALMHEAEQYGHLLVSGLAPTDAQLAVLAGAPSDQIPGLLGELESAGVFSRTRKGVIYSRRMTRDAKKAATARENGKNGGNPTLGKETSNRTSDNPTLKGGDKPQKPEARDQREDKAAAVGESPRARREPPAAAAEDSGRYGALLDAAGIDQAKHRATGWLEPVALAAMDRWRACGLTEAEALSVVKARTPANKPGGRPPNGPAYFDGAIRDVAEAKRNGRDPPEFAAHVRQSAFGSREVVR